jgi:hypothetical protein
MAKNPLLPNPAATASQPPRNLGDPGLSLWNRIMSEYRIEDCGGLEMLAQACQALDRAETLRSEIERDGEVLRLQGTVRDHPALKHEMHLSADRLERKVLGAARMSRMRTLVEPALAISSVVAGDTTLALAGHPKPSRPMPLPGGVVCGSAVAAE